MASDVSCISDSVSELDKLVATSDSLTDNSINLTDKLTMFGTSVESWVAREVDQNKVLEAGTPVTSHATFGHMKAEVLMSCTCSHSTTNMGGKSCSLHCEHPSLADIVFTIAQAVHPVFNDGFMCFANLLIDHVGSGQTIDYNKRCRCNDVSFVCCSSSSSSSSSSCSSSSSSIISISN